MAIGADRLAESVSSPSSSLPRLAVRARISKTLAVAVDCDGDERGRATAGSSNFTAIGAGQAAAAVTQAVTEACADLAPLSPR